MTISAHAETTPPAVPDTAAAARPAPQPATRKGDLAVIESAVRYYASQKQTARVEAEIRRLKRLHPGWTVPADLYAGQSGGSEEAPLWKLFGEDRIEELRAAIAARTAADPHWHPSDDLAGKLRRKAARLGILQACAAKRWRAATDVVEADAAAIDPDDVLLAWAIAEAYARTQRSNKAFEVLASILATSREADQRIGTVQKAIGLLAMSEADKLIAMGRTQPDGRNEFAPIAADIARARISAFLHDEPAQAVSARDLTTLEEAARKSDDPNQAGLIAWYHYKRSEAQDALEWFKTALAHGGDAMIAHGLAHTLRRLGMNRETEDVAYAWREPLTNNQILFIDILERDLTAREPPFIETTRLARYADVTMRSQSGEGAQALAWYAYNSCQFDTALDWFQRAVAWLPKEATVYGYALTLRRLKRRRDFFEVVNRYDGLFPSVVALVFPDGVRHPPTRCDPNTQAERATIPVAAAVYEVHGRRLRLMGQAAPGADERPLLERQREYGGRRQMLALVPRPQASGSDPAAVRMPVLRRDEFPLPVKPENNLRFGADMTAADRLPSRSSGGESAFAPEPAGSMPPAARRVPGVGAMPYERYGYALLPGWNGILDATDPTAADQMPATGTMWAAEESAPPSSSAASASPAQAVDRVGRAHATSGE